MKKAWFIGAFLLVGGCNSAETFPPTPVHGFEDTVALDFSVSGSSTCARTSDTQVDCVEAGSTGELVRWGATSSSPIADMLHMGVLGVCLVDVDHHIACGRDGEVSLAADDVVQVANDLCVRGTRGDVRCLANALGDWETVVESGASDIDYGGSATGDTFCAVTGGAVRCWTADESVSGPGHLVPGIDDAIDVELGGDHACVLREGGRVACWGLNDHGQLGGGEITSARVDEPIDVEGIDGAVALGIGYAQSCALRSDGSVACWGSLRQPGVEDTTVPTKMAGVEDAIALDDRCALTRTGQILCWSEPRP